MNIDITALTQLIGSLGFPIVMCGYMAIKFNKTLEKNTEAVNSLILVVSHLMHQEPEDLGVSIMKDENHE